MRSASFHFAMRSPRAKLPTLSWPTPQPTARCTIVTSSVSPERAETMPAKPASCAAVQASSVSVSVPRWLGFSSTALRRAAQRRLAHARRLRHQEVVADTCTRPPTSRVNAAKPDGVVLGQRILDRDDRIARRSSRSAA